MIFKDISSTQLISMIKDGKIGVLPTDTVYGICGLALNEKVVEEVYKIKKRDKTKPLIINIGSFSQLSSLEIKIDKHVKMKLEELWPGKVSVILPCESKKLKYLHRGFNTLAVRLPNFKKLTNLIKITGPLVSTSANPEGKKPARTLAEARKYFGNAVDFYVDGGKLDAAPSTLIAFENGEPLVLRQGEVTIDN